MNTRNQWLKDLSNNKDYWAEDLNAVPSMIKLAYIQLKNLAADGSVYGVMLQCKDVYEILYKVPIIMTLIVIDSDDKYKDGKAYTDIMKASLNAPMSMGQWNALASVIIKKDKELHLPASLIEILKQTRKLYSNEITPDVPDVINWRNETIGHGALRFEDDESIRQEIERLILMLKEYFESTSKYSIRGKYNEVYFTVNGEKLIGDYFVVPNKDDELHLNVADNQFNAGNYANSHDLRWYLFDSFYCKKNLIKYTSYIDGKSELLQNKYFSKLYEKHCLKEGKNFDLQSDFISREEDMILEYLNMPLEYIKPVQLIENLKDKMDEIEHGIIAIFMERGTGKSAFSNQMSGLYHKVPLIKNSLSRCYHVQNASLKGISDFINSVNFSFRHSFDPAQDLWGGGDELPTLTADTETPAEDMAEFLNYYHEKYRKEYTIFLIDGIDEMTEQSNKIMEFLPSSDQLIDGVFVVLLSRFRDEKTVVGSSKRYIERAEDISQIQIRVSRKDEENICLLTKFIEQHIAAERLPKGIDVSRLIEKADYRFLFLKAYMVVRAETIFDNDNEYRFINDYMNYILSFYGTRQKDKLKEIAVTISLFPSISISKHKEYMNLPEITSEFVGLLNDLLPVLTVLHVDGEDVYTFADEAYTDFIIEECPDVVDEVISFFYKSDM